MGNAKADYLPYRIERPTLIVNKERVHNNIKRMAEKARKSGVRFKPHVKTHQSVDIGAWFRDAGVTGITVSSVDMATYFADHGWKDITIAFPVNILQIHQINNLARDITLHLLVESTEAVDFLSKNLENNVRAWIKIDVGYYRTGIEWNQFDKILELAEYIEKAQNLTLSGILTHAGQSYYQHSKEEIKKVWYDTVKNLNIVRDRLQSNNITGIEISTGDTPCCSLLEEYSGVDEIRPGNFVFYDIMQLQLGTCREEDIALAVACPVVAKHEQHNKIIIYGGAVHLSKDSIKDKNGTPFFGRIALGNRNGWGPIIKDSYVSSISQEHGQIITNKETFHRINIGDILFVLPIHSCLAADILRNYITTDGEKLHVAEY